MKIMNTSGFIGQLHAGTFSREAFLQAAQESGAGELHVDTRFFPERAMYWTRMLRNAAAENGMNLSTIYFDSELIADEATVNFQRANLSEWIRIAALSKIHAIKIYVDGADAHGTGCERLIHALSPLTQAARQYGVMLILANGSANLGSDALLRAAKTLGYSTYRVDVTEAFSDADAPWAM